MPFYRYRHNQTGQEITLLRSIAERDAVPDHTRVIEFCAQRPVTNSGTRLSLQAQQVLDGYAAAERRGELRKTRRQASRIKEIWSSATESAMAAEERKPDLVVT